MTEVDSQAPLINPAETEVDDVIPQIRPEIDAFFKEKLSKDPDVNFEEDPQLLNALYDLVEEPISQFKIEVPNYAAHAISLLRLYRFLIGSEKRVVKAASSFEAFLKWRVEVSADEIFTSVEKKTFDDFDDLNLIRRYLPVNLLLRDSGGRPVFDKVGNPMSFERTGEANIVGLVNDVETSIFSKLHIAHMEKRSQFLEALSLASKTVKKFLLVKDFDNLTRTICNPTYIGAINVVRQNLHISQEFYPATIECVLMVNCPTIFSTVYSLVSSVVQKTNNVVMDG